jgi:hypothetical protein
MKKLIELTVKNITERDILNPSDSVIVKVLDASQDKSVVSGSCVYIYNIENKTWIKCLDNLFSDIKTNLLVPYPCEINNFEHNQKIHKLI